MLKTDARIHTILFLLVAIIAMLNGLTAKNAINYRLPKALVPTNYKIHWSPRLDKGYFDGMAVIQIKVIKPTKQIILHSDKLFIRSVYVPGKRVVKYELDSVREFLIIDLKDKLLSNETIELMLGFKGKTQHKLSGMYTSSYQTLDGQQRNMVTTKFEPTYARQAFPCFDEPDMKATFSISVTHPSEGSYDAVSNMNKIKSLKMGKNTMAVFATSVPMSTYLACIIVSDFKKLNSTVKANGIGNDFQIDAYAQPHQLSKVQFALEVGTAITEYYIRYFKVPYPLPKLDMAAIPDFAAGAMEHWGLVTYRESLLLYDENYSSTWNKQYTASILAHEITHQWFGNLVTMKWWNDLWLNEGFANFMQWKGVNSVYPDWEMLDQFITEELHPVLIIDSKLSSHPIVQRAESPDQIIALFDTITYNKAGSILRMLENLVGSEKFEKAVTNYLIKFKYGNTVTDDFLTEVAALVDDFDVKHLMRTWTEQMGYPVLYVSRTFAGFTITQQRFLSNKESYNEAAEPSEFNYKWTIPVKYTLENFASDKVQSMIFHYDQDSVAIATYRKVKWIKLNVHQYGYYRVNYENSLWDQLINQLYDKHTRFHTTDRANLLDDAFSLADASQVSYNVPLRMLSYLVREKDFMPWYVAVAKLQILKNILFTTDIYNRFVKYARSLLVNVYPEVGWTVEENNHLRNRLRVSVLTAACSLGLPDCLSQAAQHFTTWLNNPTAANRPAPDLREVVYYYGMQQSSSESSWEKLLEIFKAETDASEKTKLMYGLSGVRDAKLLYRFLVLATNESIIRRHEYFNCFEAVAANPVGGPIAWNYYRNKWPQLVKRFGLHDRKMGTVIAKITDRFSTNVKLEEVQQFFKKYPESGAGARSRQEAIETIKYNIKWLRENYAPIKNWVTNQSSSKNHANNSNFISTEKSSSKNHANNSNFILTEKSSSKNHANNSNFILTEKSSSKNHANIPWVSESIEILIQLYHLLFK